MPAEGYFLKSSLAGTGPAAQRVWMLLLLLDRTMSNSQTDVGRSCGAEHGRA